MFAIGWFAHLNFFKEIGFSFKQQKTMRTIHSDLKFSIIKRRETARQEYFYSLFHFFFHQKQKLDCLKVAELKNECAYH